MLCTRRASRLASIAVWPLRAGLMAVALLAGACSNDGSYQVSWQFTLPFAPGACGKAGVSSISIAAARQDGSQATAVVPCAPGVANQSLGDGSWTLTLTALDAEGHVKAAPPTTFLIGQVPSPVVIQSGKLTTIAAPVALPPLPACRDGVDNDRDGRVDLDDPDCGGDPDGTAECASGSPGCPEDTTP